MSVARQSFETEAGQSGDKVAAEQVPTEIPQHNRDEYLSTRKVPHEETTRSIGDPDPVDEDDLIFN